MVPKASLDYNRHILMCIVGLDLVSVPLLGWCMEDLFLIFASPPFYRTLITLHKLPLLLVSYTSMPKAPGKPGSCMLFCQGWAALSTPIADVIGPEVSLDSRI
jgi:hypothetical protein